MMFAQNHIVSIRQMKRLLLLDLFAGTSLILPAVTGRLCGIFGVFAILAGAAAAGLFALFLLNTGRCYTDSYPRFCRDTLGNVGGRLVLALYAVRYFITAALLLGVFAQIINHTFLTDIPKAVLGIAMLLVCIYCVFKGLETRARLGEMLVYLVIVPIVLIIILALPQIHPDRLWPSELLNAQQLGRDTPGAGGLRGILWASVVTFSMFSVVEWLLFLRPNVKKMEKACRGALISLLWPALLNILILCVCIGIFSVPGMNSESWPTVTLMQIVRFPGGFISRQDGLMLAFWMVGMFMLIGGNIYYGLESFKSLHKKLCKPWIVIFPALFILAVFLGIYLQDATRIFISYMTFIYMPLAVLVPLILRLISYFRGPKKLIKNSHGHSKKVAGKGKKTGFFQKRTMKVMIVAVFLSAGLSGCGGLVEIEERNFVMCLGIDAKDGGLEVSFGFPDLKALTGGGDNIHYPMATIEGPDMETIEQSYGAQANKRLDYGQLQMIVFGREMMENRQLMAQVLLYIKENQAFTRTVLVCMADTRAKDIVALDEDVNGSIGVYLRQMFDNNSSDYQLTVGDLIIGLSLPEAPAEIAVVAPGDQVPLVVDVENIQGYFAQ